MKAKKKWKKLRKMIKTCNKNTCCDECEFNNFCEILKENTNIKIYKISEVYNLIKDIEKL